MSNVNTNNEEYYFEQVRDLFRLKSMASLTDDEKLERIEAILKQAIKETEEKTIIATRGTIKKQIEKLLS